MCVFTRILDASHPNASLELTLLHPHSFPPLGGPHRPGPLPPRLRPAPERKRSVRTSRAKVPVRKAEGEGEAERPGTRSVLLFLIV